MSAPIPIRGCAKSSAAHSAKTDSASASTSSPCSVSDTTEPTAVETAPTDVAAAASKSTTTNVTGRPCYGAKGHECDANY
jgi:hypothetical protein